MLSDSLPQGTLAKLKMCSGASMEEIEKKLQEYKDGHDGKDFMCDVSTKTIEDIPIEITDDMSDIAQQIIDMGILTKKSYDDCQHIAAAVIYGCDCIISWNFKHIVNIKTIRGVRAITNLKGYKPIEILNPSVLLESEG